MASIRFEMDDATVRVYRVWDSEPAVARGRLRAGADGLFVDDVPILRREQLMSASVIARGREALVLFTRARHGSVEVPVASHAEGRALLRALEIDEGTFVARYWMSPDGPVRWLHYGATLALVLLTFLAHLPVFFLVAAAIVVNVVIALGLSYRVRIGADGVHLSRLLARGRTIPHREMSLAKREGTTVVLRAKNGANLRLKSTPVLGLRAEQVAAALVEDVNDRIAVVRSAASGGTPAMLRRDGRPVVAWLRSVQPPVPGAASYREAAMPSETLWRVLEDPTAAPTARAAAAFALRKHLDEESRARVARVAEACAAPKLRVALETIAGDDDDDAVTSALEPLEDEA